MDLGLTPDEFARYVEWFPTKAGVPVLYCRLARRFELPPPAPDLPPVPCHRIARGAARLLVEMAQSLDVQAESARRFDALTLRQRAGHARRAAEMFRRLADAGRALSDRDVNR